MAVATSAPGDDRADLEFAEQLARQLRRSTSMPLRPQDESLLAGATKFKFSDGRVAWSVGEGPLVLMVHGWGGRGVQMAGLAQGLAQDDFRCVFFDAGGHGDSATDGVGFDTFIRDTSALSETLAQPVFAWVGHSAGALGMMASRRLKGLSAERYVCISAPRFPYVPIETLRRNTGAPERILDLVKPIIAAQFESTWADLEENGAFMPESKPLLLVYDRSDERVRHEDADQIAESWPGAHIVKTDGYGHNKILQAPEVLNAIRSFLTPNTRA